MQVSIIVYNKRVSGREVRSLTYNERVGYVGLCPIFQFNCELGKALSTILTE